MLKEDAVKTEATSSSSGPKIASYQVIDEAVGRRSMTICRRQAASDPDVARIKTGCASQSRGVYASSPACIRRQLASPPVLEKQGVTGFRHSFRSLALEGEALQEAVVEYPVFLVSGVANDDHVQLA